MTTRKMRAEMISDYIRLAMRVADCVRCGVPEHDMDRMVDALVFKWEELTVYERDVIKDCGA